MSDWTSIEVEAHGEDDAGLRKYTFLFICDAYYVEIPLTVRWRGREPFGSEQGRAIVLTDERALHNSRTADEAAEWLESQQLEDLAQRLDEADGEYGRAQTAKWRRRSEERAGL